MRAKNLINLLKTAVTNKRRCLVRGKPGIGKSDIIHKVCQDLGFDVVLFHPAISDATDFSGLPCNVNGFAEFLPFGSLRKLIEAKKPTVAFIDDIGQAAVSVQAALMQLVLARRVNGHTISDDVVFVGATNDSSHMAGVSGMIEPLKSRWDTIVELEVSVDDWCDWALDNGIPSELVGFIRFRPALLSDFKPTKDLKNSPSPRGWLSVGNWINAGIKDIEVFSGAVGEGAATEFWSFLDLYTTLPSLDAIILNPDSVEVPKDKPAAMFAIVSGLSRKATPTNFDSVVRYINRMPIEFSTTCVKDALRITPAVAKCPAFVKWASKNVEALR